MSARDPQAAQHRLELALRQWRRWRSASPPEAQPTLQRGLEGGRSNHSYLVSDGERRFVVRIDGVQAARHGLSRSAEWQILRSAHAVGITPEPCFFHPELGALVTGYAEPDPARVLAAAELAALLRQIHALPPRHYRLDIVERIGRYEGQLRHHHLPLQPAERRAIEQCLDSVSGAAATVLCHNDLIPANLLRSGGRLLALDWEYAAMGDPLFDLAGAALGLELAPGADIELLEHYLGDAADTTWRAALQRQRVLCRYIELLWYLLEPGSASSEELLSRQLPLLQSEIAALG